MKMANHYKKFRFCLAVLAATALLTSVFVPALPVAAAPVIAILPASGPVGTSVNIAGSVFQSYAGDNVHVFFDTRELDISPFTVPSNGSFSKDFHIPADATGGIHWIEVRGETTSTSFIARDSFNVDPVALTLDVPEGPAGTVVDINGSGFYIDSAVTLSYYNPDIQKIAAFSASHTGKFFRSFTIPNGPGGEHLFTALNDQGNSANVTFRVLPRLQLSLDAAGPGDPLNIRGGGFAATSTVDVYLGTLSLVSANTDVYGSFTSDITVPDIVSLLYEMRAQDNAGNIASAPFAVSAGAKLSNSSGSVGSDITVQGGGFAPGQSVTVYYDDKPIAVTAADNNGDFILTITIPPSDGGKHVISISDGTAKREMTFSVEKDPPPVPALQLPADATITRAETYFDWDDVYDVSIPVTYELQIASDSNFATVVLDKSGITASQYTLTDKEVLAASFASATYYWRIKAIDGAGNASEWSAPRLFYVSVPAVPTLLSPANDNREPYPIRFTWQAVSSLSAPVAYELEIAADLDFRAPLVDKAGIANADTLISNADNAKLKKGVTYYWRIKAVDAAHNASGWSGAESFVFTPKASFPAAATWTLVTIGGLILLLLAFRLGRKTAYH
jgi:hypothetical protein